MSAKLVKPKPQHAPKAPHEDPKFLESTPARPLRILAEYIDPIAKLKAEGVGDTIVMFGSTTSENRLVDFENPGITTMPTPSSGSSPIIRNSETNTIEKHSFVGLRGKPTT